VLSVRTRAVHGSRFTTYSLLLTVHGSRIKGLNKIIASAKDTLYPFLLKAVLGKNTKDRDYITRGLKIN
jgi:hypothetical protein